MSSKQGYDLRQHENGVWYVHYLVGRRSKRKSTGTSDGKAARAALPRLIAVIEKHEAAEHAAEEAGATIGELWRCYRRNFLETRGQQVDPEPKDAAYYVWRNLEPHFGAMRPDEVDEDTVRRYRANRRAGKIGKPSVDSTHRRELVLLLAALNWCAAPARKPRLLDPSHVPSIKLPDAGDPKDRWLTSEECRELLQAAANMRMSRGSPHRLSRIERFLWLALETAGRAEAILDLTWDRVDFEARVLHLDVPGRRVTKKRRASVPISDALLPVLSRAHDERIGDLVCEHKAKVWAPVQRVVIRAGLAPAQDGNTTDPGRPKPKATGISPHTMRHTAATHMARRGVPLWIIANILGNTLAVTERTYAKFSPDAAAVHINAISAGALAQINLGQGLSAPVGANAQLGRKSAEHTVDASMQSLSRSGVAGSDIRE